MATADYSRMMNEVRGVFRTGRTKPYEWRRAQLEGVIRFLDECREQITDALKKDLDRDEYGSFVYDIAVTRNDAINCINNLQEWMQPKKVSAGLLNVGCPALKSPEPYGVALVLGAWNYPIQITLSPMIGALAAGNCVVIKPSEVTPHCASLMEKLIPRYLDTECIRVVTGGVPETTALLRERFDYIFYTGNPAVGKIIMAAAAKHLTPVTLELGGKSPVYVDDSNDLAIVANRVLWGKLLNNGQTCIAPDYFLIKKGVVEPFMAELRRAYDEFYDGNSLTATACPRIVNERHFNRVKSLMGKGKVLLGGRVDEEKKNIELTVLSGVSPDDPVMQEEIFGPLMPVLEVAGEQEAVDFINDGEKPLAIYVFSTRSAIHEKFQAETTCGGMTINDVTLHFTVEELPFGGVGQSGFGAYHGSHSFDTFSHFKSVLIKKQNMEFAFKMTRYPPYNSSKMNRLNMVMQKRLTNPLMKWLPKGKYMAIVLLAIAFRVFWYDRFFGEH